MNKATRYLAAGEILLRESGCTVRKWRTSNTGRAYTKARDWGIEAPRPRGPVSFVTFAHEIAHQLLHREKDAPRWLEEIEAWEWALAQFERFELAGIERARTDAVSALVHHAHKSAHKVSPETAQRLLDRYAWVWDAELT